MINKKSVMTVAALMIMMFHLWISVLPGSAVELFFSKTAYIGVDVFFFLSAYSLSRKRIDCISKFLISRFKKVYLKFLLFSMAAAVYSGWSFIKLVRVVCGIDLIKRGGGSFLWFLPAIMIFYLILVIFQRLDEKNSKLCITIICILWLAMGILFTYFIKLPQLFIMINRIPIFVIGFYIGKKEIIEKLFSGNNKVTLPFSKLDVNGKIIQATIGLVLITAGYFIIYLISYKPRLMVPFTDMFYVTAIPVVIGIILLTGLIPETGVIRHIGSATLEIYAVQMIWGYDFMLHMTKVIGKNNGIVINLLTWCFVLLISCLINKIILRKI